MLMSWVGPFTPILLVSINSMIISIPLDASSDTIMVITQHSNFMFTCNDVISSPCNYGRSIFSASLLACASDCHGDYIVLNASTALSCVANFTFVNSSAEDQVSMAGSNFVIH